MKPKTHFLIDKQTIREVGQALWQIRYDKHLYLRNVAHQTGIPEDVIDGMEIGKYARYGHLRKLADFYGVTINITLKENPPK